MSGPELPLSPALSARYAVLETLGSGAMGVVYRAIQISLDRPVALKLVRPEMLDADGRNRFLQEARLAARINHPHVVQVYESGEDGSTPFIVFELVNGPSLRSVMDSGPLEPSVAVQYVRQIAAGLAAAHAQGIIHRDVKPENILVTKAGEAKVADFGISRTAKEDGPALTSHDTILGSPLYMSPEQAANRPLTASTDQYSLGVVLFEMLVGRPPFEGSTGEILAQHLRDTISLPPAVRAHVPAHVVEVLEQMVRKSPERRYPDMNELVASLDKALARWRGPRKSTIPAPRPRVPAFAKAPEPPALEPAEVPTEPPEAPRTTGARAGARTGARTGGAGSGSAGGATRAVTRVSRTEDATAFGREPLPRWALAACLFLIIGSVGILAYRAGRQQAPVATPRRQSDAWPAGTVLGNVRSKVYHVVGETGGALPRRENAHQFADVAEAEKAGYRRSQNRD